MLDTLYLQVNCVGAPFTDEGLGVDYAWWNDIDGVVRNFWSGNDETAHTCQCGIDVNCIRTDLKCNCDANVAVSLSDIGIFLKNIYWNSIFLAVFEVLISILNRTSYLETDITRDAIKFRQNQLHRWEPHPRQVAVCRQIERRRRYANVVSRFVASRLQSKRILSHPQRHKNSIRLLRFHFGYIFL